MEHKTTSKLYKNIRDNKQRFDDENVKQVTKYLRPILDWNWIADSEVVYLQFIMWISCEGKFPSIV